MAFCVKCGAQIAPDSICNCQDNQAFPTEPNAPQSPQAAPCAPPYPMQSPPVQAPLYMPQLSYMQNPHWHSKPIFPGKSMIKVSGILMIIAGALGLFISATSIDGMAYWGGGDYKAVLIFEFIIAGLMLAFGIMGVVFAPNQKRGSIVIGFGIALVVLKIVDYILTVAVLGNEINLVGILTVLAACVLPILYIVGGFIRRKASM